MPAPHLGHYIGRPLTNEELGLNASNSGRTWFIYREIGLGLGEAELLGYVDESQAKAAYDRYMADPSTYSCTLIHGNVVKEEVNVKDDAQVR